jgi:hypothetical protein
VVTAWAEGPKVFFPNTLALMGFAIGGVEILDTILTVVLLGKELRNRQRDMEVVRSVYLTVFLVVQIFLQANLMRLAQPVSLATEHAFCQV